MAKANKNGWIRHCGGKQPVADNEFVQIRLRDGTIKVMPMKAGFYYWDHESESSDIMAYRFRTPKQQREPKPITAEQIRAQYMENLSSIAMLHTKNAALVDDLRNIGFDFYDAPKEPQEDMSDPRNWRVGDFVECVSDRFRNQFTIGKTYKFKGIDASYGYALVDFDDRGSTSNGLHPGYFKFHSRPYK